MHVESADFLPGLFLMRSWPLQWSFDSPKFACVWWHQYRPRLTQGSLPLIEYRPACWDLHKKRFSSAAIPVLTYFLLPAIVLGQQSFSLKSQPHGIFFETRRVFDDTLQRPVWDTVCSHREWSPRENAVVLADQLASLPSREFDDAVFSLPIVQHSQPVIAQDVPFF